MRTMISSLLDHHYSKNQTLVNLLEILDQST